MEFKEQIELAINKEMCKRAFYAGTNVDDINLDELFEDWWSDCMFELREGKKANTGDRQLTIPDVTNRTLKDGRKQAYLQGYRKSAISIEGAYSDQTEIEAKKEFDNWHFNLYGW